MEDNTTTKSPNQLYKESGSSLSFADWIQREKDKGTFLINKRLQDTLQQQKVNLGIGVDKNTPDSNNNTFVGLNKNLILVSVLIIVGAIGYNIYQKRK